MNQDTKKQIFQSVGQFFVVFLSGMGIFKGWTEVQQVGVLNAIYQPSVQGLLSMAGIWGLSKIGPRA